MLSTLRDKNIEDISTALRTASKVFLPVAPGDHEPVSDDVIALLAEAARRAFVSRSVIALIREQSFSKVPLEARGKILEILNGESLSLRTPLGPAALSERLERRMRIAGLDPEQMPVPGLAEGHRFSLLNRALFQTGTFKTATAGFVCVGLALAYHLDVVASKNRSIDALAKTNSTLHKQVVQLTDEVTKLRPPQAATKPTKPNVRPAPGPAATKRAPTDRFFCPGLPGEVDLSPLPEGTTEVTIPSNPVSRKIALILLGTKTSGGITKDQPPYGILEDIAEDTPFRTSFDLGSIKHMYIVPYDPNADLRKPLDTFPSKQPCTVSSR